MSSNGKSWVVRRSYENFEFLDRQAHQCIFDRKYSQLSVIPQEENVTPTNGRSHKRGLKSYIRREGNDFFLAKSPPPPPRKLTHFVPGFQRIKASTWRPQSSSWVLLTEELYGRELKSYIRGKEYDFFWLKVSPTTKTTHFCPVFQLTCFFPSQIYTGMNCTEELCGRGLKSYMRESGVYIIILAASLFCEYKSSLPVLSFLHPLWLCPVQQRFVKIIVRKRWSLFYIYKILC